MEKLEGHFELPNLLEEIRGVQDAVVKAVCRCGYGEQDRFAIQLALEEALANAIRHGNSEDPSKKVCVAFTIDGECVRITVQDEGEGFNPDRVPDPTTDENIQKPFGRGVMLMRVYMDEVRYNDCGNCVTLVKRRTHESKATLSGG